MARRIQIAATSNRRRSAAAGDADVSYVKAHINRGSAGNNVLDLEFSDTVTGSDFETGITIGVGVNGSTSDYTAIDKSETSSIGVVSDKYIRYTFDGTVSSFQGWNASTSKGHNLQVSISGSPLNVADVSAGVGNSRALENGSTVNLLDLFTHGYDMDEATGAERADAIGSLNFDDVNSVTQEDPVSTATVKSAGFTRGSPAMRLTHADNAAFDSENDEYFGWMLWVYLTANDATEFIVSKQNSGVSGADWNIMYHGSVRQQFKWGVCKSVAHIETANWASRYSPATEAVDADTWYMIAGWFDPTDNAGTRSSYVNVTKEGDAFDAGTTDEEGITSDKWPSASDSGIEFGSVNGGSNYLDGRVDAAYWFKKPTPGPSNDEISDFFNGGDGKQWPFIPDSE